MDIKSTYLWKLLSSISIVLIFYFLYICILQFNAYVKFNNKLISEEIGTDNVLQEKIAALEKALALKDEYIFKLNDNPTNLSRIIEIDGLESFFGVSSTDIILKGIAGNKALFLFQNKHYKLAVNDTLSGWKLIKIKSSRSIEFEKDGVILTYSIGNQ